MVEDIVSVKTLVAGFHSTKFNVPQWVGIEVFTEKAFPDVIAISCLSIVQIQPYFVTIQTEVEVRPVIHIVVKVSNIDGVTNKYPPIAEVRTNS